jgi:hypothetical protein
VTLIRSRAEITHFDESDAEALIHEARRLRRRRWTIGSLLVLVVVGCGIGLVVAMGSSGSPAPATRLDSGQVLGRTLPEGPYANLDVAGPLAVAPAGALYVADVNSERVLVRLPNGRFRVIAGDGEKGASGDGAPAVDAEFLDISDMAVAPNGSLYIVDGERVRVVTPNGMISTVAGIPERLNPAAGRGALPSPIANGTPARSVSIDQANSAAIALSEQGQLSISTGSQLLRLINGRLDVVQTRAIDPPYGGRPLDNLGQIAIDAHGDIYVSGGNGWSIWRVAPDGTATAVTNSGARRSGGSTSVLARAPDGTVYGEDGATLLKIEGDRSMVAYTFPNTQSPGFWLTYFALGVGGTVYADEIPGGGGFENYEQLRTVRDNHSSVLWQETAADVARADS